MALLGSQGIVVKGTAAIFFRTVDYQPILEDNTLFTFTHFFLSTFLFPSVFRFIFPSDGTLNGKVMFLLGLPGVSFQFCGPYQLFSFLIDLINASEDSY